MYVYIWPHPVGHVDLGDGTGLHRDVTRHLGGNLARMCMRVHTHISHMQMHMQMHMLTQYTYVCVVCTLLHTRGVRTRCEA